MLAHRVPFARAMDPLFFQETSQAGALERESRQPESAARKPSFRPPGLPETSVVSEPFARVSPRLRCLQFFEREVYS